MSNQEIQYDREVIQIDRTISDNTGESSESKIAAEIALNFKASLPIASITMPSPADELFYIELLGWEVANKCDLELWRWDIHQGLTKLVVCNSGVSIVENQSIKNLDIFGVIDWLLLRDQDSGNPRHNLPALLILCDIHHYITGSAKDPAYIRALKNLAIDLQASKNRVVILGCDFTFPESDFGGLIEECEFCAPKPEEIKDILFSGANDVFELFSAAEKSAIENMKRELISSTAGSELSGTRIKKLELDLRRYKAFKSIFDSFIENDIDNELLIKSCLGLSKVEIFKNLRKGAIKFGRLAASDLIEFYNQVKLAKLKKLGVELIETPKTETGGLSNLKSWLKVRTRLFNEAQSNTNLPAPKGILLVGPPGTGKSLAAKSIGKEWGIPIMRLDMGAMFNSLVGESEANMRRLLKTAEAIAPVVLLVDEIDKTFPANNAASTDSGVTQRLFGYFLTWMQEKKAPVFVVATANKISHLPPELLRKGRFDEIFFVDLPSQDERLEICKIFCQKFEMNLTELSLIYLAETTQDFTGAEIESLFLEVAIASFSLEQSADIELFKQLLPEILPQAKQPSTAQYLLELRQWSKTVRSASACPPAQEVSSTTAKFKNSKTKAQMSI